MSAIFEYTYNGTTYRYELTLKAKAELEKYQKQKMTSILNGSPEDTKALTDYMQATQALETAKASKNAELIAAAEERLSGLQANLVKLAGTLQDLDEGDDELYEVMYILLHNHRDYRTVTRELSDEIIEDMEYKLGVDTAWEHLNEVYNEVFTRIEAMNAARQKRLGGKKN